MPIKEFLDEAERMADELRSEHKTLKEEEGAIREHLYEIEDKLSIIGNPDARLDAYKLTDPYSCPVCFMKQGVANEVSAINSDSDDDTFHCGICGFEVSLGN